MNLMYAALNNVMSKNPKINVKIKQLQQKIKDEHIKFTDNFKKMRGLIYFDHTKVQKMVEDKIYPEIKIPSLFNTFIYSKEVPSTSTL